MKNWSASIKETIDTNLKGANPKDIRFFRVDEFKRNCERIEAFSPECPACYDFIENIKVAADNIHESVQLPGKTRRDFDKLTQKLASHLRKQHGFYPPFFFVSTYSFIGITAGVFLGFFALKFFPSPSYIPLIITVAIGLIAGYFSGSRKDNKIRRSKKLM